MSSNTHSQLAVIALTREQAEALTHLPELVELMRRQVPGGEQPLSARSAARLVKRRTQTVIEALRSGELAGRFIAGTHGGRGHYEVMPSDAVAWARRAS